MGHHLRVIVRNFASLVVRCVFQQNTKGKGEHQRKLVLQDSGYFFVADVRSWKISTYNYQGNHAADRPLTAQE